MAAIGVLFALLTATPADAGACVTVGVGSGAPPCHAGSCSLQVGTNAGGACMPKAVCDTMSCLVGVFDDQPDCGLIVDGSARDSSCPVWSGTIDDDIRDDFVAAVPHPTKEIVYITTAQASRGYEGSSIVWDRFATYAFVADPIGRLQRVWSAILQGKGSQTAPAAIATSTDGSKVFVTGAEDAASSMRGDLVTVAYDALKGTELWRRLEPSAIGTAIAASDDAVFVGSSRRTGLDVEKGRVQAFETSGALRWQADLDECCRTISHVVVSKDGQTVIAMGPTPHTAFKQAWTVNAFRAETGTRLWTSQLKTLRSARVEDVLVSDTDLYVTGTSGAASRYAAYWHTEAIDLTTGVRRWEADLLDPLDPQGAHQTFNWGFRPHAFVLADAGKTLVVTGQMQRKGNEGWAAVTVGYDTASGAEIWRTERLDRTRAVSCGLSRSQNLPAFCGNVGAAGNVSATGHDLAIVDGKVLVVGATDTEGGEIHALDPVDGKIVWSNIGHAPSEHRAGLDRAPQVIAFASGAGAVVIDTPYWSWPAIAARAGVVVNASDVHLVSYGTKMPSAYSTPRCQAIGVVWTCLGT